jgi:hypothetical protein
MRMEDWIIGLYGNLRRPPVILALEHPRSEDRQIRLVPQSILLHVRIPTVHAVLKGAVERFRRELETGRVAVDYRDLGVEGSRGLLELVESVFVFVVGVKVRTGFGGSEFVAFGGGDVGEGRRSAFSSKIGSSHRGMGRKRMRGM